MLRRLPPCPQPPPSACWTKPCPACTSPMWPTTLPCSSSSKHRPGAGVCDVSAGSAPSPACPTLHHTQTFSPCNALPTLYKIGALHSAQLHHTVPQWQCLPWGTASDEWLCRQFPRVGAYWACALKGSGDRVEAVLAADTLMPPGNGRPLSQQDRSTCASLHACISHPSTSSVVTQARI